MKVIPCGSFEDKSPIKISENDFFCLIRELPSLCLRILGAGGCGCGGLATRGMKAIIIPFNIFSFIGDSAIIFHGTRDFIKVPKCTEPKSFIPFIVIVNFRSCGVFFSFFFRALVRMFFPSQLRLLLSCQKRRP